MRHFLIAVGTLLVFLLAGWIGYYLYGEGDGIGSSGKRPSFSTNTGSGDVQITPKSSSEHKTWEEPNRGRTAVQKNEDDSDAAEPEDEILNELTYLGREVDENSQSASVCFTFSDPLNANDNVRIRDYITLKPDTTYSVAIKAHDVCLSGLDYGKEYAATLKRGLPGLQGLSLVDDISVTISFGDKPAFVGFAGEGIILPRIGAQGLALETVNVDELDVQISRVPDRMLARRNPNVGETVLEGDYSWEGESAAKYIRSEIWSGQLPIKSIPNQTVTTVMPLNELIGELQPGAYIVNVQRAHDENEEQFAKAWRWIIVTDMALTSYRGRNGLSVTLRSIDTARTLADVDIELIAGNNDVLARVKTDRNGSASFDAAMLAGTGVSAPKTLLAYGKDGDFAMLDMMRPSLDMSAYDIGGRRARHGVDIYGFTERGVYRPGETVYLTAMLRDDKTRAISDRPVMLRIRRPNGMVLLEKRIEPDDEKIVGGVLNYAYEVPKSAARGIWSFHITPDGQTQSKTITFSVEDFVPQKLSINLKSDDAPLRVGEIRDVNIDAQFLYGAPGAALLGVGEARIVIDKQPFKGYKNYSFGPASRSFREEIIDMGSGHTDGAGLLTLGLDLKNNDIQSVYPLRAQVTVGVSEPGGRFVRESLSLPIRTEDRYVGIASGYESHSVPEGMPARMKIIILNALGQIEATNLHWQLVEEDSDYHWYNDRGTWRYRHDVRDVPISSGKIETSENAPTVWTQQMPRSSWGNYRLDLKEEGAVIASRRFYMGWGSRNTEAPDQLDIKRNKDTFTPGEMVKLSIRTPYAGAGELVIANEDVKMVRSVALNKGISDVSFRFDPNWGDSVYALLTLYTPRDVAEQPVPRRAAGVSYIALNRTDQTLSVEIKQEEVMRPRQNQTFTVTVDSPVRGEKVWVNFAAIDEGILQLTKYKSPDAAKYYFGKKAFGMRVYDDYGRILNPNLGTPSEIKSGGDSLGGEGLTVVPTKTISFFKGQVPVKNGQAHITLSIPEFNGKLRLMATAWSERAIGSDEGQVTVRDKVPALVSMPRFLAPGDQAEVTMSLDNVEGAPGVYKATLEGVGPITVDAATSFNLAKGKRQEDRLSMQANQIGVEQLAVNIMGPGEYEVRDVYPISVRSPYYPITRDTLKQVDAGGAFELDSSLLEGLDPSGTDITVSFSRLPGLDPVPIVSSLQKYPYGCTEQTVSKALPLLYAERLGGIPGQSQIRTHKNVQAAVNKLFNRQSTDGAFGLWREGDRHGTPWLGVYVADFLYRAKEQDYYISDFALKRATKAITELSRMPRRTSLRYNMPSHNSWGTSQRAEAAAYAHYVLAKNGHGRLSQIRYHFDNNSQHIVSPLAMAYLGGALSLMGDEGRATRAFESAISQIGYNDKRNYYQSDLRDLAGVIAILSEVGKEDLALAQTSRLSNFLKNNDWLNTQEKGYLVLAFNGLLKSTKPIRVKAQNVKMDSNGGLPRAKFMATALDDSPRFINTDKNTIWASISTSGTPIEAPEPTSNGFSLTKKIYNMKGKEVDTTNIRQGERMIVKLTYTSTHSRKRSVVIADLLPAGFEIETILQPHHGFSSGSGHGNGTYRWLGKITSLQIAEARDDRFVASLTTNDINTRTSAYIVRAVTPGSFVLPGAVIEDMYRPEDHAITRSSRVGITAESKL